MRTLLQVNILKFELCHSYVCKWNNDHLEFDNDYKLILHSSTFTINKVTLNNDITLQETLNNDSTQSKVQGAIQYTFYLLYNSTDKIHLQFVSRDLEVP